MVTERHRFGFNITGDGGKQVMTVVLNDDMFNRLIRECANLDCWRSTYLRMVLQKFLPGEKMVPIAERFECFAHQTDIPKSKILQIALEEYWENSGEGQS